MSRFFKRAIDAYRILTGRDDAVQKGIMQLQKEIVEREARRAAQQAKLEEQILRELRQSAEALKSIKDGYVAQEEELAKFAAALGQSAQAQLAAQADAEARMMLEAARRSGMQVELPPSFSDFIKQTNGGLASSEAMSIMLEQVHRRQAGQEVGLNASWEVGGWEAVEGRGRSGANEKRKQDLNQLASQDMIQSAADAVQGAGQDANLKAGRSVSGETLQGSGFDANEHVGLEAGRTSREKDECLSNKEDEKAAVSHLGTSPRLLDKEGKRSVDVGKLPGLHAMAAKVDDAAHLFEGIPKQEPESSLGGQQPELEGTSSEGVKPWGQAVEEARPKEGLDKTREEIATFIDLSGESSSGPGAVAEASGLGSLQMETLARSEHVVDAKEADSLLPPLESQVVESNGQPQSEPLKTEATSRNELETKSWGWRPMAKKCESKCQRQERSECLPRRRRRHKESLRMHRV